MTTIKLRRGTAAEWTTNNPILAAGEMGIETDTRKFKFGDGTTPWNTLAYASAEGGGGGTGDVTAAGDNYFTGNNTFTGTTKFDNDVSIHGANLEVAGALEAATGNITNLQVPNTLTSSGEINAVSINTTGLRSDDIQTTANKKYLTEVDVDNQTIQMVDGKLHANLDTKQDILVDGNGTKIVDNKVDIYQGIAGIRGLNFYQNNGTITKNNDLSITFNNGACGYIFLENKGINNDYEIILHQNYLGIHGSERDCNIVGVRCLPQAIVPTPGEVGQGECWFDTYDSPFRVVAVPNGGSAQVQTVDTINYIKYIIKGTNLTISYSSTGEAYTDLYTIAISSTYVINVCIANSPWRNDIAYKWTNSTLYSDSYILDKTTNTYLMKQGIIGEGVAVATSNKYGLVLPDNSTIVSNNGVISAVQQDLSTYATKEQLSTAVDTINSTKNNNIFDISKFTVVGSPTITDDGVLSLDGTNNRNNHVKCTIPEFNTTKPFKLYLPFKGVTAPSTSDAMIYYLSGSIQLNYTVSGDIRVFLRSGTSENYWDILKDYRIVSTSIVSSKKDILLAIEFTGSRYILGYIADNIYREQGHIDTTSVIHNNNLFDIGWNIVSSPAYSGQIDLKQFSITVDGEQIFNGLMESTKPIYDKITSTSTKLLTFQTDTDNNFSAVNSALNEKANLSDLANYVPLATYNALLARVEALENKNQ